MNGRLDVLGIGDHAAVPELGLIHEAVGLAHRGIDRLPLRHGAAHADGEAHVRVVGDDGLGHPRGHLAQAGPQEFRRDARQDEQELVAADAHHEVAVADGGAHGRDGRLEGLVAHLVAVNVVHELEVVEVNDGHARVDALVAQVVLVIAPVVGARERVAKDQLALVALPGGRVEGLRVEDDTRLALHLHVAGRGHVVGVAHVQHLGDVLAGGQDVLAHKAHAGAFRPAQQAERLREDGLLVE